MPLWSRQVSIHERRENTLGVRPLEGLAVEHQRSDVCEQRRVGELEPGDLRMLLTEQPSEYEWTPLERVDSCNIVLSHIALTN
jgi:hypothetical protein